MNHPHQCYLDRYPVRVAVIDLDRPPPWFISSGQATDHMDADKARRFAGTQGEQAHDEPGIRVMRRGNRVMSHGSRVMSRGSRVMSQVVG